MSQPMQHPASWAHAYLPVIHGEAPAGTVSLQTLTEADVLTRLIPLISSNLSTNERQAAITIVHFAIGVATELLIPALGLDGVTVEATANQLGIVLGADGSFKGFWVASNIGIHQGVQFAQCGKQLSALLKPIVAAIQIREKLSPRGLELVLYDAIWRGSRRLENSHLLKMSPGWINELLKIMGDSQTKRPRLFAVQADEGKPVEMMIPRVCCVLANQSTPHACPTCPQHSETDRLHYTETWLRSLDEDGFRAEAGRARILK